VICLDTDFLVAIMRGEESVKVMLDQLEDLGIQATTSINAFELYFGASISGNPEKNMKSVEKLLSRLHVLSIESEHAKIAGKCAADLKKTGKKLDFRDVLIGSIAISQNIPVLTRNVKHFYRIEGLDVRTW